MISKHSCVRGPLPFNLYVALTNFSQQSQATANSNKKQDCGSFRISNNLGLSEGPTCTYPDFHPRN